MALRRTLFVACSLVLIAGPVAAERADVDKPAIVDSDGGSADFVSRTSVFTGDVVLTKGTVVMRADRLTVRQDLDGYMEGIGIATRPGAEATFRQKRDGVDEVVDGRAGHIRYDERNDRTQLSDRAVVRWIAGGRDANEVRGDRIVYDNRTERFVASAEGHRTRAILQPRVVSHDVVAPDEAPLRLQVQPAIAPGHE